MSTSSKATKTTKSSTKSGSRSQSDSEWSEWYRDDRWQCDVRERRTTDGKWLYEYSHPEHDTTPRTRLVTLPENEDQDAPQLDDELPHYGSPGYVAYAPPPASSLWDSGGRLPEALSPEEPSSSTMGSRDGYESTLMSSGVSTLTQQFSQLSSASARRGYGPTGYVGMAPQQIMMENPGISPSERRNYHASGYGPRNHAFSSPTNTSPYEAFPQQQPGQFPAKQEQEGSERITDTAGAIARAGLHKDFKVYHSREFSFGRVFKILWAEPSGQVPTGENRAGTDKIETKFGEQAYATIRRFVIVRPGDGHCLCLPILTYKGKATRKNGVKPQDHAIVYIENSKKPRKGEKQKKSEKKTRPTEVEGEEKLSKKPIGIKPISARDQLDQHSRLNYAKIYTVEHNLKVSFIGSIHKDSIKYFRRDYNATHGPLPQEPGTEFSDEDKEEVEQEEKELVEEEDEYDEEEGASYDQNDMFGLPSLR